jgi:hypothetical protein
MEKKRIAEQKRKEEELRQQEIVRIQQEEEIRKVKEEQKRIEEKKLVEQQNKLNEELLRREENKTPEDIDVALRRKKRFNLIENIEKRDHKNSLLEENFRTKVLEKKKEIEEKNSKSLSPKRVNRSKPKQKFYKDSRKNISFIQGTPGHGLPPLGRKFTNNFDDMSTSNRSISIFDTHHSHKKRIPIREMSLAITDNKTRTEKKLMELKKVNPRKEMFSRLKLLDSIGYHNPESNIGSIRKGYIKNINKSIDPMRENSKPYYNFLEDQDLQLNSFDIAANVNDRYKNVKEKEFIATLPQTLEFDNDKRRGTKDYTSISTTLTSDKKSFQAKQKLRSMANFKKPDRYSSSSNNL